jgi:hypothetical protein
MTQAVSMAANLAEDDVNANGLEGSFLRLAARRVRYQLGGRMQGKLAADVLAMVPNGFDADAQFGRDLFIGEALPDQAKDLLLSRCKGLQSVSPRFMSMCLKL